MGLSVAQSIGDICTWPQLRAAAVQDALYVNGGNMAGFSASLSSALNGSIFSLNFSQGFATNETAFESLFTVLPTTDTAPLAVLGDGMMFANNDELYLYG